MTKLNSCNDYDLHSTTTRSPFVRDPYRAAFASNDKRYWTACSPALQLLTFIIHWCYIPPFWYRRFSNSGIYCSPLIFRYCGVPLYLPLFFPFSGSEENAGDSGDHPPIGWLSVVDDAGNIRHTMCMLRPRFELLQRNLLSESHVYRSRSGRFSLYRRSRLLGHAWFLSSFYCKYLLYG